MANIIVTLSLYHHFARISKHESSSALPVDGLHPFVQAVIWYRKAAERGYGVAIDNLGMMYLKGSGVEANPVRAQQLFREAAEKGTVLAQLHLGQLLLKQDCEEAVRWLRKAADQGNPQAKETLKQLGVQ
jgi:TPR repeat protein